MPPSVGRGTQDAASFIRHCQSCDATIRVAYLYDGWAVCRSCEWQLSQVSAPELQAAIDSLAGALDAVAYLLDPTREAVPDPPSRRGHGAGAPRIYPVQDRERYEYCPACDSDYTAGVGTGGGSVVGYRDCLSCGQRYSYPRAEGRGHGRRRRN